MPAAGVEQANPRSDEQFTPPEQLAEAWTRHPAIVKLGDPVLRTVAEPIARLNGDVRRLVGRMKDILAEAEGLGLAAPQIGVSSRVIVYRAKDQVHVLINPKIVSAKGEQIDQPEGCLSIPGLQGAVRRAMEVRVKGFDERGRPISRRAAELESRVIQHEIDHLDGILFIDRAEPETLEWVIATEDQEGVGDGNLAPRE